MPTKQRIIRTAGLRGKTKFQIADALDLSLSHVARTVNKLTSDGELEVLRRTPTGAAVYVRSVTAGVTSV